MTNEEKLNILQEAKELGIVDIDVHNGEISYETIKLASDLTKKHKDEIYSRLNERRKSQIKGK